jgi:hypothetical protein
VRDLNIGYFHPLSRRRECGAIDSAMLPGPTGSVPAIACTCHRKMRGKCT